MASSKKTASKRSGKSTAKATRGKSASKAARKRPQRNEGGGASSGGSATSQSPRARKKAARGEVNMREALHAAADTTSSLGDARARQQRKDYVARPRRSGDTGRKPKGTLIIIGGHEDKKGDRTILRELVRRLDGGKLVVTTVASQVPDEVWADYEDLFRSIGVKSLYRLDIESRQDAGSTKAMRILDGARGVFFTGGDQLKITSQMGDSPLYSRLQELYDEGGVIAGTSAGASVMSETMLVAGQSRGSARIGNLVEMAPGFGLARDMIIDQHFAERGRIGRLIAAVSQNPRILGVGIDEDTGIIVEQDDHFEVIGNGAVYVVDASTVTYTNVVEEDRDRALSVFGVRLHILSQGDRYDLRYRVPSNFPAEVVEERLEMA